MPDVATTTRAFLVWPSGTVEEVYPDGSSVEWSAPGLYDELVLAGYPLHRDDAAHWDGVLDLLVDPATPSEVVACTSGAVPRERPMSEVSELFLRWYRDNAGEIDGD